MGHRIEQLEIEGIDTVDRAQAHLSAGLPGVAAARHGRHREHRPRRPRVLPAGHAGRRRRPPPGRQGRARRAGQPDRDRPRHRGRGHPAHARRGDPGARGGGARRGRAGLPAGRRHGGGHGPAHRRDPRAGQLAARGRERPRRRARLRPPEPRDPVQLRARLDLQGVHGRRRARGGPDPARARVLDVPPELQVADRTIGEAHDGRQRPADRGADPGPLVERRHRDDRPEARRHPLRPLGPPLRLRASRPASTCPASSAASSST